MPRIFIGTLELLDACVVFLEVSAFHFIDEEYAVEVVDFVEDATSEKTVGFKAMALPITVLKMTADATRSDNMPLDAGKGKTTFLVRALSRIDYLNLWIDQGEGHK